jgi:hypothetical protein
VTRAVHDRGGRPTDAPIDRSEHDLADWEILMDALENALEGRGVMNTDEMRRGIESMAPSDYESASYYDAGSSRPRPSSRRRASLPPASWTPDSPHDVRRG